MPEAADPINAVRIIDTTLRIVTPTQVSFRNFHNSSVA
ncbi:protein of unknown function [Shinella sp. WSC3-e]|nr:protein of unknown function [Shinella sp. WSC3-e]